MRAVTMPIMKNKSVHNCWFAHHVRQRIHCIETTLKSFSNIKFKCGGKKKMSLISK